MVQKVETLSVFALLQLLPPIVHIGGHVVFEHLAVPVRGHLLPPNGIDLACVFPEHVDGVCKSGPELSNKLAATHIDAIHYTHFLLYISRASWLKHFQLDLLTVDGGVTAHYRDDVP